MSFRLSQDLILGLLAFALGVIIIFWWAPLDSDTGLAEKVRGRWSIGDALAPTVAGVVIAGAGLFITIGGALRASEATLSLKNLAYLIGFIAIVGAGFLVMRFAGPAVADLAGIEYRPLRDERPWKYIGFILGGGGMIFGLMSLIEGRLSLRRLALALTIAALLAFVYDLPFEDLLLPPNGDV